MSDYENTQVRPDARLIILKALAAQANESLHSGFIEEELRGFMIDHPAASPGRSQRNRPEPGGDQGRT